MPLCAWQGLVKLELGSKTLTLLASRVDDADARAPRHNHLCCTPYDPRQSPRTARSTSVTPRQGLFPVRNRFELG